MTFADLKVGDVFEFDHSMLHCEDMVHGPWRKITAQKYEIANRMASRSIRLGSTRIKVVKDGPCGGGPVRTGRSR